MNKIYYLDVETIKYKILKFHIFHNCSKNEVALRVRKVLEVAIFDSIKTSATLIHYRMSRIKY